MSVFSAEVLKMTKSKVPLVCALAFCLGPIFSLLLMVIAQNPEMSGNLAAISGKVGTAGLRADWATHLGLISQTMAVGGALVFGFLTAWVFGREHVDKTAKDFLALPVRRSSVVLAKLLASIVATVCISLIVGLVAIGGGLLLGLDGGSPSVFATWSLQYLSVLGLTVLLVPAVAFAASAGRGYLPALGLVIVATILAQILGSLGVGKFFPWAIPALSIGMAGNQIPDVGSYMIMTLTALCGVGATLLWWEKADHK